MACWGILFEYNFRWLVETAATSSSGRCWASEVNNPFDREMGGSWDGGFALGLMRKDLGLAIEAAKAVGAGLELAEKVDHVYESVQKQVGEKDFSSVYKWLQDRSAK